MSPLPYILPYGTWPPCFEAALRPSPQAHDQPLNPKLVKWAAEEEELKIILGTDELPPQRISHAGWKQYGEFIAAGNPEAEQEFTMRCLRLAYGIAKKFGSTVASNELTVEDHFHHAGEGIFEGIQRYNPKKSETLNDAVQWGIYNSLQRRTLERSTVITSIARISGPV